MEAKGAGLAGKTIGEKLCKGLYKDRGVNIIRTTLHRATDLFGAFSDKEITCTILHSPPHYLHGRTRARARTEALCFCACAAGAATST